MGGQPMDQIEALKAQHGQLEDLFHEITLAQDVPTRTEILQELARVFVAHVALEERLLRRAAATAPREEGLWQAWEARLRIERIVIALDAIDPGAATCATKVASLQDLFEDRLEYEETQLFPKLQRFAGQQPGRESHRTFDRATRRQSLRVGSNRLAAPAPRREARLGAAS